MTPRAYRRALTVGLIVILGWLPAAAAQAEERRYEGRTLSDWAHLLQDPDPSVQRKAVEALRLGFEVELPTPAITYSPRCGCSPWSSALAAT